MNRTALRVREKCSQYVTAAQPELKTVTPVYRIASHIQTEKTLNFLFEHATGRRLLKQRIAHDHRVELRRYR